jgi:hypothetical protein
MNGKEDAILIGPCLGELWWEFFRFAPYCFHWIVSNNKRNIKTIVFTRPDRFDIYGKQASTLVPLRIEGDGKEYIQNCFRLDNFSTDKYEYLINTFRNKYSERFNIVKHLYPDISKKNFLNKEQFPTNSRNFVYVPRSQNERSLNQYIDSVNPIVVIASRYRKFMPRNWPYWQDLYDMIADSELMEKYSFVICGKDPDYVPDSKGRFYDLNYIEQNDNISLIGLTIELFKRAKLTIGSQSGIPNISLLMKVPVIMWGHQRQYHTVNYNITKTKVTFIDDQKYNCEPEIVFNTLKKEMEEL